MLAAVVASPQLRAAELPQMPAAVALPPDDPLAVVPPTAAVPRAVVGHPSRVRR